MSRLAWGPILEHAADIVYSYSTGVTLRQLFYRLVADGTLVNSAGAYKQLSSKTAEARRYGVFPDLIDPGRGIHRYETWDSPENAVEDALQNYRRDHTEFQDVSVYLGVEKKGIVAQLQSWFGDHGIPILALGGYSSQTYVADVRRDVMNRSVNRIPTALLDDPHARNWRPAVLLYAGDFDPSGEDIDRDFVRRTYIFDEVVRVALTAEQVSTYQLPPAMGKASDSRAGAFMARHGQLVQVELDALPPDVLHTLYAEALEQFWDVSAYERSLTTEQDDVRRLTELVGGGTSS